MRHPSMPFMIANFYAELGLYGGSFSIECSPDFARAAKKVAQEINPEDMQQCAVKIACKVFGAKDNNEFAMEVKIGWGEYGIEHISVPGKGCGLDWSDYSYRNKVEKEGFVLAPHNVDNYTQTAALLAIWLDWAERVLCEMENV